MDTKNINYKKILWGKGEKCNQEIPKIVWIYWDSHKLPPLVNICIYQLKKILVNFEIRLINKDSLKAYLPNIHRKREELPLANYSDLVRLFLLREYGGIWMDASILLTENLDWIYKIKQEDQSDLVGFYSEHFTSDKEYPLLETWFIATSPQNKFITAWASEFEKCYTSENPHRYFDEEKKNSSFLQKIDEPSSNYLIAYLAAAKIMRNNQDFRLSMISSADEGHYYTWGGNAVDSSQFGDFFTIHCMPTYYPRIIKFMNNRRCCIDYNLKIGRYKPNAFLFKITQKSKSFKFKIKWLFEYSFFILSNFKSKIFKYNR